MAKKYFDFSPFLNRSFDKASRGGALADIFEATGETLNNYGANADEKLLGNLANETDKSKIDNTNFYNPLNAITAQNVVDKNIDRNNALEQTSRNDAEYYKNLATNNALNDAMTMTKDSWEQKWNNAGGVDFTKTNQVWNNKEDRKFLGEDREREAQKDNLQMQNTSLSMQNTRNQMARQQEEYDYKKKQLEQSNIDNKFTYAYASGYIPTTELESYKDKVSPEVYNGILKQQKLNDITNNYATLQDFRNSEEWKTTPIEIKNEIFKSKIYEQPKSTYEDKKIQDYIGYVDDLSVKVGTDDLANYNYKEALENKTLTQNDIASYTYKLSKAPGAKEIDKKMISGDFAVINQKAALFAKAANNPNLDTGAAENIIQQVTAYLPDWGITKDDLVNQEFRSAFLGFGSTLLKIQSGATVTDKERTAFFDALGTLSKNKKVNMTGILDKLGEAEARYGAVKSASPEYFNIKYGDGLNNLKKSKTEIENFLYGNKEADKNDVKVIGDNVFSNQGINSNGKNNSTTPVTTPKILTPEEAKKNGITFN